MSASRRMRGRACDACHGIKIKCELGAIGTGGERPEPPCERCVRLGKICAISPPVRQKDRIAELEAKLEEMTRLLKLQRIQNSPGSAVSDDGQHIPPEDIPILKGHGRSSKKRRLEVESLFANKWNIDDVVSKETQLQLYNRYRNEIEPVFPFPVTKTYQSLRNNCPYLLLAVMFAASPGMLPANFQDELTSVALTILSPGEIIKIENSIDLVNAILIISFWYRPARNQVHVAIDRYLDLAVTLAEELGLSKVDCAMSTASNGLVDKVLSSDAWRTWHFCFLLASSLSICMRMPCKIAWDTEVELKLSSLEYGRDALESDTLLCQIIRGEGLCQQIIVEASNSYETTLDITDNKKIQRLQNLITDRKAQVFSSLRCPSLALYEHVAHVYLRECILHTPTNRNSFAAPYIAERLSLTDFPRPIITPDHVSFLYGLRAACHSALDTFLSFDLPTIANSPLVVFTAKAFYAQWLLVKLYVASTASGNTYGAVLDPQSLHLEAYLGRMAALGDAICKIHDGYTGKMLQSSRRLREWVWNCDAIQAEESLTSLSAASSTDHNQVQFTVGGDTDWTIDSFGYGLDNLFGTYPEIYNA